MRSSAPHFYISINFQKNHEKICKPDFVSHYKNRMPVIYLRGTLLHHLS